MYIKRNMVTKGFAQIYSCTHTHTATNVNSLIILNQMTKHFNDIPGRLGSHDLMSLA